MNWLGRILRGPGPRPSEGGNPKSAPAPPYPRSRYDLYKKFADMGLSAAHLRPTAERGFSRLGGRPCLGDRFAWPTRQGQPLAFMAQLDLAEVRPILPSFLPERGWLYFFYDLERTPTGLEPDDRGAWRVLYDDLPSPLPGERAFPSALAERHRLTPLFVAAHRVETLPAPQSLPKDRFDFATEGALYDDLCRMPFEKLPAHQFLGHPRPVRHNDMELQCQLASHGVRMSDPAWHRDPRVSVLQDGAADWRLLLQIDGSTDSAWTWGGTGTLYVWVRESAARAGDLSQTWLALQR